MLVVDNRPLQAAAWSALRAARRRLGRATRDLHRHEQVDEPGFRAWLGRTFPELVTDVRELTQKLESKSRIVEAVEQDAWISGRSPRAVWREWQRDAAQPPSADDPPPQSRSGDERRSADDEADPFADDGMRWEDGPDRRAFDALFNEFCTLRGLNPDDPATQEMRDAAARNAGFDVPRGRTAPVANDAREIYRRLVQHLHPDRGGDWTPRRAQLWHNVQEAWASRDADMLARLEAEWEIAADTLGPASPLGRLRAAHAEIHAAQRDAERKVRLYRKSPMWRFSLAPPNARRRDELRCELETQRYVLLRRLGELEAIIARWERSPKKRPAPARARSRAGETNPQPHFAFDFSADAGAG